jgi:hypothetical protein
MICDDVCAFFVVAPLSNFLDFLNLYLPPFNHNSEAKTPNNCKSTTEIFVLVDKNNTKATQEERENKTRKRTKNNAKPTQQMHTNFNSLELHIFCLFANNLASY